MGTYGIGVSRTVAAAAEQNHDKDGIIWPLALSPFPVEVVPTSVTDEPVRDAAEKLYGDLRAQGVEAPIDDRDERPGVKFKDADLIGFTLRLTVGQKARGASSSCASAARRPTTSFRRRRCCARDEDRARVGRIA